MRMLHRSALSVLVMALAYTGCPAQTAKPTNEGFAARTFKHGERSMPYRLFVPANYDKNKRYPLILWLHGGGARGSDNEKQITEGNTLGATIWTRPENQQRNPAFVVAPQAPIGEWWANNDDEMRPSVQLRMVVDLLMDLQNQYSVDAERLYVGGQSMGGYGTWSIITDHPKMFAAAIPICGGGNRSKAKNLVDIPIWAFHGDADSAVDVSKSREMIEAIKRAGGVPRYTEYKGVGHTVWHQAFAEPDLLTWVFAQKRKVER